jgi:hypothetical protein
MVDEEVAESSHNHAQHLHSGDETITDPQANNR